MGRENATEELQGCLSFGWRGNIPFALYQGNLYTYHRLAGEGSQLLAFVDKDSITQIDTKDLSENDDTRRIVVELLRKALGGVVKVRV